MKKCLIYFELSEISIAQLKQIANQFEFISCSDASELREHQSDAEILATFTAQFDANLLASAPNLKWIQAITAGVDNLPLKEIKERQINFHIPGCGWNLVRQGIGCSIAGWCHAQKPLHSN